MKDARSREEFRTLSQKILDERWDFYPPVASKLGIHRYDGMLPDLSAGAVHRRLQQIDLRLRLLEAIDRSRLSTQDRLDYSLLELALRKEHLDLAELRVLETDPMKHLGYLNVTNYIQRTYAPLIDRIRSLTRLLSDVPDFIDTMLGVLRKEVSRPLIDVSIESYEGLARFYREDLANVADGLPDKGVLEQFKKARDRAALSVDRLVSILQDRRNGASPDFAIGSELYQKMLRFGEMVDAPLSRILEVGQKDLERNLEELSDVAARIDPAKPIRELIEAIGRDHPSADGLIPDTGRILEDIRRFVVDHDVLTLPSSERCLVKETPAFMRWAFAAMDTPGLLEDHSTESYYYVTPVEGHWTEQQKEEWLSDFNYNTIQIVSIHEAYPGHFVHFLHSRGAPSLVGKALWSYSFSEGWAHYTEEMMLKAGYGSENPYLKLSQICDALLRDCRYLCSLGMHTQGMDVQEATSFFMEKAYMSEFPAKKEALRGTFDPGYLNYTLGKLMILRLEDAYHQEAGPSCSLKQFHDSLLSFGSPPVPLLREVMLKDPDQVLL